MTAAIAAELERLKLAGWRTSTSPISPRRMAQALAGKAAIGPTLIAPGSSGYAAVENYGPNPTNLPATLGPFGVPKPTDRPAFLMMLTFHRDDL